MSKRRKTPSSKKSVPERKKPTLPEPFPSPPARPGRFVFYMYRGKEQTGVTIFCEPYSAKKFMEAVLEDDKFEVNGKTLRSSSGIKIRCDFIQEVVDHKYTKAEKEWELPHPHTRSAYIFRYGKTPENPNKPPPLKPERARKPKDERKPRPSREGLITIQQLAAELEIEPRIARAALRKAKLEKPEAGWAWANDSDLEDIRTILRGAK